MVSWRDAGLLAARKTNGYLKPEYSLKLDGKDLSHLSPGERGTLLLVFYLLVDKSNKPIIVDQPEENLDS